MHSGKRHLSSDGPYAASARFAEMPRLTAPRPVKRLPQAAIVRSDDHDNPRPFFRRKPDLHTHSLGYGIDE